MSARSASTRKTGASARSEEHTSELQSLAYLVCRLLLEKKKALLAGDRERAKRARLDVRMRRRQGSDADRCGVCQQRLDGRPRAFFLFIDPATTEIYTLSLHDALPI